MVKTHNPRGSSTCQLSERLKGLPVEPSTNQQQYVGVKTGKTLETLKTTLDQVPTSGNYRGTEKQRPVGWPAACQTCFRVGVTASWKCYGSAIWCIAKRYGVSRQSR